MKMQGEGRDGDTHRESGTIKMEAENRVISTGMFMRTAVALRS